jgi:hypothetical protein
LTQLPAHFLFIRALPYPPRAVLNTAIWTAGIALECMLAIAVFLRRIARRYPAFAALMVFYPVRSVVLYLCEERVDGGVSDWLYGALSFAAILLEMLPAVEIGYRFLGETGGWRGWRMLIPASIPLAAGALAWVTARAISGRISADYVDVFFWFVMLGLFAAMVKSCHAPNLLRISGGFAAFSLMQLASLAGRTAAFVHRNAGRYLGWSYVPAIGYLAVVVFWLVALRREPGRVTAERHAISR